MKDNIQDLRIKSRFILEIRHEPILELFDKRGDIIKDIHPRIKNEFQHWRVEGNTIVFFDNINFISDALISVNRFGIGLEDRGNLVDFRNYLGNFIFPVYTKFQNSIKKIQRIGFRIITILKKNDETFEEIRDNIINKTCKLPITKLAAIDYRIHIILEKGFYLLGPVKPNEQWLKECFRNSEITCPGYGIDIDSYIQDIEIDSKADLERAILALIDVSKGNEEQLAITLGLIDVAK